MNVAIIPAREGSKRIPDKNIRSFVGKPLIAYSITAARESEVFDDIIVSTDSREIARVAVEYGARAPFMRPKDLADDNTPTAPVLRHAFQWLRDQGSMVKYGCCIYATAAFVSPHYLRLGHQLITERKVSSVFSVTTYEFPIFRSLKINVSGCLEMIWPQYEMAKSQELPEAYHDAGQFYWLDIDRFLRKPRIYTSDALPVILPRYLVQDVDTLEDWDRAEIMYRVCKEKGLL